MNVDGLTGSALPADSSGALRDARLREARALAAGGDVERAVDQFEALLGAQLFREMRRGVEGGFFGSGSGAGVFEGWLDEQVGEALAKRDALGLAQAIRASLGAKKAEREGNGGGA